MAKRRTRQYVGILRRPNGAPQPDLLRLHPSPALTTGPFRTLSHIKHRQADLARTHDRPIMKVRPGASYASPARIQRSRAADGSRCTVCTDGSVHEPVHAFHGDHRMPATERYRRRASFVTCLVHLDLRPVEGLSSPPRGHNLRRSRPSRCEYQRARRMITGTVDLVREDC